MSRLEINWGSGTNTGNAFVLGIWQGTYAESYSPARNWEIISQEAVDAIRLVDSTTPVMVSNYFQNSEHGYGDTHTEPWIDDPYVVYEWHQYFDVPYSGVYDDLYDEDLAQMEAGS